MPIEFFCSGCNRQLRVPDETAGRKASCPSCGAINTVPTATDPLGTPPAPSEDVAPLPPEDNPFAGIGGAGIGGGAPTGGGPVNPYASPSAAGAIKPHSPSGEAGRDGPAWERDGKSFGTFWETVKMVVAEPTSTFLRMRRHGGLGDPIIFAICGGLVGALAGAVWGAGIQVIILGAAGNADAEELVAAIAVQIVLGLVQALFQGTIGVVIGLFIGSGILHLMLMMVGGANRNFETTFRVVAYVNGAIGLMNVIPCIGPLIGIVCYFVSSIIGVSRMHEISGGKAALAVLLPMLICLGLLVLLGVLIGIIAAVANAAPL